MEKQGDLPPTYDQQQPGPGYGIPQAPPSYNQGYAHPAGQPQPPYPQQQYPAPPGGQPPQYPAPPGGQPPAHYQHPPQGYYQQQYPNVVVQQPIVVGPASGPPPPDHMTAAIFATLCCFWPTGIVAIIKANDAKSAWMRGDSALAHANARSAKSMVNVSIIAGICSIIFIAVIVGVYVGVVLKNINDYNDDY